ncbi:MAG: F0F1 ATP synthase subunit delta [Gammaproteobacteria bacterium]|nr:F0F1 ATP synthase subunit delta [Gammaproteobacteria bacterium]
MQETQTLARPYAQAAFELAHDAGSLPAWSDALALLALAVQNPQLQAVLGDPRVGTERGVALVLAIGGERFFAGFGNFVRVLGTAGRLGVVPEIARLFERLRAQAEGIADVEVVSAYPLEATEEQGIVTALERRLGKRVRVSRRVDPAIIAGAVIRVGDLVFDATLRGRLRHMASQLQ